MNRKIFSIILILSLLISICSFSFAATEALNSTKNAVMNVGNAIGNGVKDVANGATNLGKDAVNTTKSAGNSIVGATSSMNKDGMDYTATRTATSNNVMGLSSTAWTWLILGIVGIVIVALVWYYGAQYEHRNYNHE